uniref:Reverse transcriptase domain-containing protein n=2 Tax=Haemonchus contortus TaxID=6289 RepID=A0A7I5ECP8_HAECO
MEKVIYDFYSDLFDSHVYMPTCHLRQDGYVVPSVLSSEIRHAITSMRNGTAPGPDRIKAEHLKSQSLSKPLPGFSRDDIGHYRPICLLPVIYKLFTRVIPNRIGKILDEGQPCEQAGFWRGSSTIDHIHTVTRLIEKAFDTVETEAVNEALGNQGVPTQYVRMLRELYNNFTTRISPFYEEVIINVKRGVRQGDTISPELFSAALENVMRHMEWESMGVKVDGRYLHHLRFADDIVLITPNIEQAEQMLAEFDNACGKIGLRLNLTKTMFMRNGLVPDAPFMLNGTNISECSSYVYLGRKVNMMNDLAPELS